MCCRRDSNVHPSVEYVAFLTDGTLCESLCLTGRSLRDEGDMRREVEFDLSREVSARDEVC